MVCSKLLQTTLHTTMADGHVTNVVRGCGMQIWYAYESNFMFYNQFQENSIHKWTHIILWGQFIKQPQLGAKENCAHFWPRHLWITFHEDIIAKWNFENIFDVVKAIYFHKTQYSPIPSKTYPPPSHTKFLWLLEGGNLLATPPYSDFEKFLILKLTSLLNQWNYIRNSSTKLLL